MADKLTTAAPKIAKLLRMVLSPHATTGEWENSFSLLMATLKEVDPGGHEITKLIEAPPSLNDDEIKEKIKGEAMKIFEAGRTKGRAEEVEKRQRSVVAITSLANGNDDEGVNGHDWREVVGFCLLNKHRIRNVWEANYIDSVAGQLANPYYRLTAKQTPIVRRIFQQWFNATII